MEDDGALRRRLARDLGCDADATWLAAAWGDDDLRECVVDYHHSGGPDERSASWSAIMGVAKRLRSTIERYLELRESRRKAPPMSEVDSKTVTITPPEPPQYEQAVEAALSAGTGQPETPIRVGMCQKWDDGHYRRALRAA